MIEWSKDQKEIRSAVQGWSKSLNELCNSSNSKDNFQEKWDLIRRTGLLTVPVDRDYGGLGLDVLTTMYVLEEFGKNCEDGGLSFSVSSHIVSTAIPIQTFGSIQQKDTYLSALCSGERIGAHAITESETGSDAWKMKTTAEDCGDYFLLNGIKSFISNGPIADTFIVYAQSDSSRGTLGGFTAFIVEKPSEGFSTGSTIKKMGLNGSPMCELHFTNCKVAKSNVLGKVGNGFSIFNHVMKWEILLSFIINVGEMSRQLQCCVDYSKARYQGGVPISKYQAISHKLANMNINLLTAKTMLYQAGSKFLRGQNITTDLAVAKVVASENYVQNSLDALQIYGAYGYTCDAGIEEYLRNAVAGKIYSGSSEIQRNTIALMMGL